MTAEVILSTHVSIENLINLSFDYYQKNADDEQANFNTRQATSFLIMESSTATADDLRLQIYQYLLRNSKLNEEGEEEVSLALIQILKATLANIASSSLTTYNSFKSSDLYDATLKIFEMVAYFGFAKGDGRLAGKIMEFVEPFAQVDLECMRGIVCDFMSLALRPLYSFSYNNTNNNKIRDHKKSEPLQKFKFFFGCNDDDSEEFAWREEITSSIKDILAQRLQDRSQAVRLQAIQAVGYVFVQNNICGNQDQDILGLSNPDLHEEITQGLLWNLNHDPSFANRSAAINSLPVTIETLPSIVLRTRDSKLKVRVEALDLLCNKVDVKTLTREQRVAILQSGLSTRYPSTYHAATKMLCCGWMKSVKFDPVKMLELLETTNSVENGEEESCVFEDVSVNAARAIIAAASDNYVSGVEMCKDGQDSSGKEIQGSVISTSGLTLAELSSPEIREYKEYVLDLKRFHISTMYKNQGETKTDDEDGADSTTGLTAASVLYIESMCDMIMESGSLSEYKKSSLLAEIIPDVIVLGEVIETHMKRLSEIQMELDAIDEEEDERVAAYEAKEDNEVFICLHLLKLAKVVDLNEEGTRRHFSNIIHRILCNPDTHVDLVEGAIVALSASHDSEAGFLLSVSEILSNVIETETVDDENIDADTYVPTAPVNPEMKKEHYLRGIEILSVALEKTSRKMSSNAILQNFSSVILMAITDLSLGPLVREAGVICFGRYVILMEESTIMSMYKPILMEIAYSEDEKIEIRAQAMLALCDLAFMFHRIMAPILLENVSDTEISISDLLYQMLSQPRRSLAIVAAECAAKLLLNGKMHDANIVAHLVAMYFDKDLVGDTEEGNVSVKEVGSPTRLAQLLTIFFPAYSMGSAIGRETLNACTKPLLRIVHEKMSTKVKGKRTSTWPIAKMVEYICHTIESGEEAVKASVENDEEEEIHRGPSPILNAAIAICGFINEDCDELSSTYLRALCKILNKSYIDVESEDSGILAVLKQGLNDLAIIITDDTAMRSLEDLIELVDDVGDEPNESRNNKSKVDDDNNDSMGTEDEEHDQSDIEMEVSEEMIDEEEDTIREEENDPIQVPDEQENEEGKNVPLFATIGQKERDRKSNSSARSNESRTSNCDGIPLFASLGVNSKSKRSASTRTVGTSNNGIPVFASIGSSEARTVRDQRLLSDSIDSGSESESESDESSFSSGSDEYSN